MGSEKVFEKEGQDEDNAAKRTAATKCNTMKVDASIRPGSPPIPGVYASDLQHVAG